MPPDINSCLYVQKKRYVKVVHSVERTSSGSSRKVGFERRMSTGRVLFAYFGSGFAKTFGQITSIGVKTLSKKNVITFRHIRRKKALLVVDLRRSKTPSLKLTI